VGVVKLLDLSVCGVSLRVGRGEPNELSRAFSGKVIVGTVKILEIGLIEDQVLNDCGIARGTDLTTILIDDFQAVLVCHGLLLLGWMAFLSPGVVGLST
jgi:hypothetical protein